MRSTRIRGHTALGEKVVERSCELGISQIGSYVPEARRDNLAIAAKFDLSDEFIRSKVGFLQTAAKSEQEETSDLCLKAFHDLQSRSEIDKSSLDLIVVVTQNPDGHGIPHTSAILHGKLGLPKSCFAFDISLACSGYVAALAAVKGFLAVTGGTKALLFTADPYSKVVDVEDRDTVLIFGDAAAVSLIEPTERWQMDGFDLGTDARWHDALTVNETGKLTMNGRSVFNFCALAVPDSVARVLRLVGLSSAQIDRFVLHPGSKYLIDTLAKRIGFEPDGFEAANYGNTGPSSIPMILKDLDPYAARTIVISGFGVGLSWATCILRSV